MPTLVCTGCTSGLGWETLKLLVQQTPLTWTIFLGARSAGAGQRAVEQLHLLAPRAGHHVEWLPLDLALLSSTKTFAGRLQDRLKERERTIDVVLLNAGVYKAEMVSRAGGWSEEAVVNHFAQSALLSNIVPQLAPAISATVLPRIVLVSSALQNSVRDLDTVRPILRGEQGTAMNRYSASKFVQMVGAHAWKERLRGRADVVAVSPGFVPTSGLNRESSFLQRFFLRHILSWAPFCTSVRDGALSILRLVVPPPDIVDQISSARDEDEVLYLGVTGERQAPSELIKAGGAELQAQWMVDEQEMEQWAEHVVKLRKEIRDDPVFGYANAPNKTAPVLLTEHGKTKNPFPNVDAASGSLLYHFGLTHFEFFTVTFGTSRFMGALSQLVWDRALGLPLERPKSLSMQAIQKLIKVSITA